MRIAYKDKLTDMTIVREFDNLLPVSVVSIPKTMKPDETEKVCEEAVFVNYDNDNQRLYVFFKTPREYYVRSHNNALSIGYNQVWKYVLEKGFFDFTKDEVNINDYPFVLDCEIKYV